jgi:hypothetical protein
VTPLGHVGPVGPEPVDVERTAFWEFPVGAIGIASPVPGGFQ